MANDPSLDPYAHTFARYVQQGVALMLQRVQQTPGLLPDEMRIQALHTLSFAFPLPAAWPLTRDLLLLLAPKMEQAGHREDWMPYLERGIISGESQGDRGAVAECQLQLGLLYRLISDFAQAKVWLALSQESFAQVADAVGQARALNERAWVGYLQHHYAEATALANQVLTSLTKDTLASAMSYRVLGMIAIDQKQWEKAEKLHRQAFVSFQQIGDTRRSAWSLQNLGYALNGQKKFYEAITCYQMAADLLSRENDQYHLAIVQMNLGIAYSQTGYFTKAIEAYLQAQPIFQKMTARIYLAKNLLNLGVAFLNIGEWEQAERAFRPSIDIFQELHNDSEKLNVMDGLGMALLEQAKYDQARGIFEQALAELPKIQGEPNYEYLHSSLYRHQLETQKRHIGGGRIL